MRPKLRHRRLAREMAKSRLSQNGWALRLGIDKGHLSRLANGKRPYPGPATRRKLLTGLKLPFEELFEIEAAAVERRRFSDVGSLDRQRTRDAGNGVWSMFQDIRFAVRHFRRSPGFTFVTLATLALAIGANTGIFSVIQGVILKPLPYGKDDRLVLIGTQHPSHGGRGAVSYLDFLDWRRQSNTVENLAVYVSDGATLTGADGATRVSLELVSSDYFAALGVPPQMGRTFLADETGPAADAKLVVASHGFWRDRMGGSESALGQSLTFNGQTYRLIGVMPKGFRGLSGGCEAWLPIGTFDSIHPELREFRILQSRGTRFLTAVGLLSGDETLESSRAQMGAVAGGLAEQHPRTNANRAILIESAREVLVGSFRRPLLLLLGAAVFLLLIGCGNLANLNLARASRRTREMAIRRALGASRLRVSRQVLTESLLLSVGGGMLGVGVAWLSLRLFPRWLAADWPNFVELRLDLTVLGFTLLLSMLAGVLFGLFPALRTARADSNRDLRDSGRSGGIRKRWTPALLVAGETALAFSLLIATGLMLKSFEKARAFDPGFETKGLMTASLDFPAHKYSQVEQAALLERVVDRIGRIPGVDSAALTSHTFFGGGYMTGDVSIEGHVAENPDERIVTYLQFVSPGFFEALGATMLAGREFTARDRADAPKVVVINRGLAERFWPGQSPLGKRIAFGSEPEDGDWREVVGVAADVQPWLRRDDQLLQIYAPFEQGGLWSRELILRTGADAAGVVESVRTALREVDPEMPLFQIASMEELMARSRAATTSLAALLTVVAVLALGLASIGVYGVMSYIVSRARPEIGLRLALGATPRQILGFFVRYGGLRAGVGLLAGFGLSFWLVQLLESQLFEVEPLDGQVFVAAAAILAAVGLLACLAPSLRASRLDPLETIRAD